MLELICLACWTGLAGGSFILLIADHSSSRAHAHSGANLVNVRASKVTKLVKFVTPRFDPPGVNFKRKLAPRHWPPGRLRNSGLKTRRLKESCSYRAPRLRLLVLNDSSRSCTGKQSLLSGPK